MSLLSWLSLAAGVLAAIVAVVGIAHVILHKRDVRAAIGWAGLIALSPFVGAMAYSLFGINRIRRRAARLTGHDPLPASSPPHLVARDAEAAPPSVLAPFGDRFVRLAHTIEQATGRPLLEGNAIAPLIDGDQAYPAMLAAIDGAERSVLLTSYIFDHDPLGLRFVEALAAASARGVAVRVLIDGVGARYSRPSIEGALRRCGVPVALFLPTRAPLFRHPYLNLRNHRKVLVVDGREAFVGGLNIRHGCLLASQPAEPVQDLHFAVRGPAIEPIFQIAAEDWTFTTGEALEGDVWARDRSHAGEAEMHAFGDGPDEDFETLRWTLLAGLAAARDTVRIATPYFLPDATLLAGLRLAVLRGVDVDILLPEKSNLLFVQWASTAQLWQVLEPGCRVWLVPPPFDHSKAFVVDGVWSLVGSANWDMRSLRLNFELGLACYDHDLAQALMRVTADKMARGRRLTREEIEARSLPVRLRDGAARLFAPYL